MFRWEEACRGSTRHFHYARVLHGLSANLLTQHLLISSLHGVPAWQYSILSTGLPLLPTSYTALLADRNYPPQVPSRVPAWLLSGSIPPTGLPPLHTYISTWRNEQKLSPSPHNMWYQMPTRLLAPQASCTAYFIFIHLQLLAIKDKLPPPPPSSFIIYKSLSIQLISAWWLCVARNLWHHH